MEIHTEGIDWILFESYPNTLTYTYIKLVGVVTTHFLRYNGGLVQAVQGSMKNEKDQANELQTFIAKAKKRFPHYEFINCMVDKSPDIAVAQTDYTILVMGVPEAEMCTVYNFFDDEIWGSIAPTPKPLPAIILLQRHPQIPNMSAKNDTHQINVAKTKKLQRNQNDDPSIAEKKHYTKALLLLITFFVGQCTFPLTPNQNCLPTNPDTVKVAPTDTAAYYGVPWHNIAGSTWYAKEGPGRYGVERWTFYADSVVTIVTNYSSSNNEMFGLYEATTQRKIKGKIIAKDIKIEEEGDYYIASQISWQSYSPALSSACDWSPINSYTWLSYWWIDSIGLDKVRMGNPPNYFVDAITGELAFQKTCPVPIWHSEDWFRTQCGGDPGY